MQTVPAWKLTQLLQTGCFSERSLGIWLSGFELPGQFWRMYAFSQLDTHCVFTFVFISEISRCEGYSFQGLHGRGLLERQIDWPVELYWKRGEVQWLLWKVIHPHILNGLLSLYSIAAWKVMHGILATVAFELKGTQGLEYIFLRLLAQAIFQVFLGYFGY